MQHRPGPPGGHRTGGPAFFSCHLVWMATHSAADNDGGLNEGHRVSFQLGVNLFAPQQLPCQSMELYTALLVVPLVGFFCHS